MRISVVIPAYNEEKYLTKTLASLTALIRKPDEVIVVDCSSTDRTAEIAQKFGAKVITREKKTVSYARQEGVNAASGDVIAMTDSDTLVPPLWLTRIEQSLSGPGIVATCGCYIVYDGKLLYRLFINTFNPIMFWVISLFKIYIVGGQNMAFWKKSVLTAGGFPVDFQSLEDLEIMRRLASVGKVIYRTDNTVMSSGRRSNEGWAVTVRVGKGYLRYFLKRKADTFSFPDIR